MRQRLFGIGLAACLVAAPAAAQVGTGAPAGPPAGVTPAYSSLRTQSAEEVRDALANLLREYPPALREVLRLSPSLSADVDYLQPYPALAAFFAAHPEIQHNPAYYLGTARQAPDPAAQRLEEVSGMMAMSFAFLGLMTLLGVMAWMLRALMDHHRWKRALRVQADAHAKILERLSSTDDVLAYAQSPAGRQFLESGAPAESTRPALVAPLSRILWSVQLGTVIAVLGIGVLVYADSIDSGGEFAEVARVLAMFGAVGLSIGVGLVLSAAVSYRLSRRLGLLAAQESQHG